MHTKLHVQAVPRDLKLPAADDISGSIWLVRHIIKPLVGSIVSVTEHAPLTLNAKYPPSRRTDERMDGRMDT